MPDFRVIEGDCRDVLATLDAGCVQTCVTSPPYWDLRDYDVPPTTWADGWTGCLGLEPTPEMYVAHVCEAFGGVWRVLADDGTVWLNLGDSYAAHGSKAAGKELAYMGEAATERRARQAPPGLKPKDLVGIPWRVALALQAAGWYLRCDVIWEKPNLMPESVGDRPTRSHEYLFLLSKSAIYFYDSDAIREPHSQVSIDRIPRGRNEGHKWQDGGPGRHNLANDMSQALHPKGRNKRSVWTIPTAAFPGAHFATFPPRLVEPCIRAGSRIGDTVLDPFNGSGTTGLVAARNDRDYIGIELNPEHADGSRERIQDDGPLLNEAAA